MGRLAKYIEQGRRMRAAREAAGLSQAKVADMLGVAHSSYGQYERGIARPPKGRAEALSKALGLELTHVDLRKCLGCAQPSPRTNAIRGRRRALGLTVGEAALRAGLDHTTLRKIEHNHSLIPRPTTAHALGKVLGMDPSVVAGLPSWTESTPHERLRSLRYRKGWSTAELGSRSRVNPNTIGKYECQALPIPGHREVLDQVCFALAGEDHNVLWDDDDPYAGVWE